MIRKACDVLVIGGGPAGIAAAVAAARSGAGVVLLEQNGFLGGMASSAISGSICGLYHRNAQGPVRYLCDGFPRELAERLMRASSSAIVHLDNGLHALSFDTWHFRLIADQMVCETPGIVLLLHSTLYSVDTDEEHVTRVQALIWNQKVEFHPISVVDCSGEATATFLAGGEINLAPSQAVSVIFSLDGVNRCVGSYSKRISILRHIVESAESGRIPNTCRNISFAPSYSDAERVIFKLTFPDDSHGDWMKMTRYEVRAREAVDEIYRFLVSELDEFRHARLVPFPLRIGIRTGRSIAGRHALTEEEVLGCKKSSDGIACGAWPIEEWGDDLRPRLTYLPEGQYYEIPAGCLMARQFENVFAAGRCLSASPKAMASARVIATSLATGWAAGTLAAFQAAGRSQSAAVQQIREEQVMRRQEEKQRIT